MPSDCRRRSDKLPLYATAASELGIERRHQTDRWANNRAENSHQPTRRRQYKMQRFKSAGSAQRFLFPDAAVYNVFNVQRHLTSGRTQRKLRSEPMNVWQEAATASYQPPLVATLDNMTAPSRRAWDGVTP